MPIEPSQLERYRAEGYLMLPRLFARAGLEPLIQWVAEDAERERLFAAVGVLDYIGWTKPGDDLIGRCCRLRSVTELARMLIGDACYHYHSKLVRKPPGRAGALDWHQDFGSWYKDGCLLPDMLTVVVALTEATADNGCLEVMPGSHRLGRLDRLLAGHESYSYFSLNSTRLNAVQKRYPSVKLEMVAGDALVFHANTLHASGVNLTGRPRVLLEMSYNACNNLPVFDGQAHHRHLRLDVVDELAPAAGGDWMTAGDTRLIDINDPNDPGAGIFRRSSDCGQC